MAKLNKALYGLRQSDRAWGHTLGNALVEWEMEQSRADFCVFRKMDSGKGVLTVIAYVDDPIVIGTEELNGELLSFLNTRFPTSDLGEVHQYLGSVYTCDTVSVMLHINQTTFVKSPMQKFNITVTSHIPAYVEANLGPKLEKETECKKLFARILETFFDSAK